MIGRRGPGCVSPRLFHLPIKTYLSIESFNGELKERGGDIGGETAFLEASPWFRSINLYHWFSSLSSKNYV